VIAVLVNIKIMQKYIQSCIRYQP